MDGRDVDLLDVMNPLGMFLHGHRQREYCTKDILPLSGKLIPEFDGRRSIRDMFSRKPSLLQPQSANKSFAETELGASQSHSKMPCSIENPWQTDPTIESNECNLLDNTPGSLSPAEKKRPLGQNLITTKPLKRTKSSSTATPSATNAKGQRSLEVFFKPKAVPGSNIDMGNPNKEKEPPQSRLDKITFGRDFLETAEITEKAHKPGMESPKTKKLSPAPTTPRAPKETRKPISCDEASPSNLRRVPCQSQISVHDPIESKDSWSKLFTKPAAPRCEGHNEPCISLVTKKSGMNFGRSFWMCARPLGSTGAKESNTQWRCQTFIWCSDWNSIAARDSVQEGPWLGSGSPA